MYSTWASKWLLYILLPHSCTCIEQANSKDFVRVKCNVVLHNGTAGGQGAADAQAFTAIRSTMWFRLPENDLSELNPFDVIGCLVFIVAATEYRNTKTDQCVYLSFSDKSWKRSGDGLAVCLTEASRQGCSFAQVLAQVVLSFDNRHTAFRKGNNGGRQRLIEASAVPAVAPRLQHGLPVYLELGFPTSAGSRVRRPAML